MSAASSNTSCSAMAFTKSSTWSALSSCLNLHILPCKKNSELPLASVLTLIPMRSRRLFIEGEFLDCEPTVRAAHFPRRDVLGGKHGHYMLRQQLITFVSGVSRLNPLTCIRQQRDAHEQRQRAVAGREQCQLSFGNCSCSLGPKLGSVH